ncbi:hypothetical protein Tco_0883872 [Tanacetum coccineum]
MTHNVTPSDIQHSAAYSDLRVLQEKDTVIRKLKDRINSLSRKDSLENVKKDIDETETINIELEHSVAKLLLKNENLRTERENLKSIYKDQFDSIRKTRVQSKEHCDSLIAQINAKSVENLDLNDQLHKKVALDHYRDALSVIYLIFINSSNFEILTVLDIAYHAILTVLDIVYHAILTVLDIVYHAILTVLNIVYHAILTVLDIEVNKARGARDTLVVIILEVNSIKDLVNAKYRSIVSISMSTSAISSDSNSEDSNSDSED